MAAADHPGSAPAASEVAERLREAAFVRFLATPDGDALAAVGLLARARDGPFQASVTRAGGESEADLTVTVGTTGGDLALTDEPLSETAHAVARELDAAEPTLALVGITAAGESPAASELVEYAGVERAPGVARPVEDVADALAHTTFAHAPFSGDPAAAREALDACSDGTDPKTQGSLLALSVAESAGGCPRATDAVGRALRPHDTAGPFETVEGYADVLDCAAREAPGTGIALALGYADADRAGSERLRAAALDSWRTHARTAHETLAAATLARHRGLVVATCDGGTGRALEVVARLVRDYRSPESVVCATAGERVAVAGLDPVVGPVRTAAGAIGVDDATGRGRHAVATVPEGDHEAFVARLREEVAS